MMRGRGDWHKWKSRVERRRSAFRDSERRSLVLVPTEKVGVANPDYTKFTDAAGKEKPWHGAMRKAKDGTLTPWVPMGVCAVEDGTVYIETISPFTLLRFTQEVMKKREK